MFIRHGRILIPLLCIYAILAIVAIFLKDNIQAMMIFPIVSMLLSVGATVYSLDYILRFFAIGEDRIFHISCYSRAATCLRASMVLIIYLMCFFLVGQIAMSVLLNTSSWQDALLFCGVRKIVSLFCAFSLMLLVSAGVKFFRSRSLMRIVGWSIFAIVSGVCAGLLIMWLSDPIRMVDWAIGFVNYQTVSVYAGVIPVMIPADAGVASVAWVWLAIDAAISVLSLSGFMAASKFLKLNYLGK
jgi:hypothetical protein